MRGKHDDKDEEERKVVEVKERRKGESEGKRVIIKTEKGKKMKIYTKRKKR